MYDNQLLENSTLEKRAYDKTNSDEGIIALLEEMMDVNASESDVLKIKSIFREYAKVVLFAKEKEFEKAKGILKEMDIEIDIYFTKNSFEFYCCQLLSIPSKSYLEFKMKNREEAILLINQSMEYSILLQEFPSSYNIGLFVSEMLMNLAKVHLSNNEIREWYDLVVQTIHFLTNFTAPAKCKEINISNFKKTSLRYFVLVNVISNTLVNIVKYKITRGHELISSIVFKDISEPIVAQINLWKELNVCLNQKNTTTEFFKRGYHDFLSLENADYNLHMLKLFLKNRVKKEGVMHN